MIISSDGHDNLDAVFANNIDDTIDTNATKQHCNKQPVYWLSSSVYPMMMVPTRWLVQTFENYLHYSRTVAHLKCFEVIGSALTLCCSAVQLDLAGIMETGARAER